MSISITPKKRISTSLQNIYFWIDRKLTENKAKGAIDSLDGVRALAFLIVLAFHVGIITSQLGLWTAKGMPFLVVFAMSGFSGVTLFFVLSGFLLFLPYSQALLFKKSWPEAKIYYVRRILRIFPLYYFSLFLLVMFHNPYLLAPHNWIHLLPFLTFTMNFDNSQAIDGPFWTLAVEFQYYLLLPLIALGIYGLTRLVRSEKRFWVVIGSLLAMIVWGLMTRRWGDYFASNPQATFLVSRSLLNKMLWVVYGRNGKFLEDFAVGMLIAVSYVFITNSPKKEKYLRRMQQLSPWLGILSLLLFTFAAMRHYSIVGHPWPIATRLFQIFPWTDEFGFALSYGCGIIAVLFNRPNGLLRRVFEWRPLRWIGLISYGLYIWHLPFLLILQTNLGPSLVHINHFLALPLCWLLIFGISASFSFFTYVSIEKPGLRLSDKLRQQWSKPQTQTQIATRPADLLPQDKNSEHEIEAHSQLQPHPVSHASVVAK